MKKTFSIELKLIVAATVVMLSFVTAVLGLQIFSKNNENMTFVYNSARTESPYEVNISDIIPVE